jgi:hypothetical protein
MGHYIDVHNVIDVEFSEESQKLVQRLSKNPYDVFRSPYLGYMVFLFSHVDSMALSWIREYALTLDSLTGSDVGFMLLGARIPLKPTHITHQQKQSWTSPPSYQSEFTPWQIKDLVESGHMQFSDWRIPDSNSFCVNEAVYSIAREMNITEHLPCIVAFDGLPQPGLPHVCIPIRQESLTKLYSSIQAAIGKLQQKASVPTYRSGITGLSSAATRLSNLKSEATSLNLSLGDLQHQTDLLSSKLLLNCTEILKQCVEAVELGQPRRLRLLLASLKKNFPTLSISDSGHVDIPWEELTRFRKTIHMLGKYASRPWPLDVETHIRLKSIYDEYVHKLVNDLPDISSWRSATQVEEVQHQLEVVWRTKVDDFVAFLPSPSQVMRMEEESQQSELHKLCREITQCETRIKTIDEEIIAVEWQIVHTTREVSNLPDRPSFCAALQSQCTNMSIPIFPSGTVISQIKENSSNSFWTSWVPVKELLNWICNRSFSQIPKGLNSPASTGAEFNWQRPPTAFASYATVDRQEVLRRVQGMRAWQPGLDIFLDFHSLFPGERWRDRLEQEIRKRDRFLLFLPVTDWRQLLRFRCSPPT